MCGGMAMHRPAVKDEGVREGDTELALGSRNAVVPLVVKSV